MKKYTPAAVHGDVIRIFAKVLGTTPAEITPETAYQTHAKWDSLTHLEIVSELEAAFNVSLSMPDVIALSTVKKAEEILLRYVS